MPGDPEERRFGEEKYGRHMLRLSIDAGKAGKATLSAYRIRFADHKAPFTKVLPPDWTRVDSSRDVEVDGYPGLEIEGLSKPTTHMSARVIGVGNSLYIAEVEGTVDPRVAEAFLGSLHVDVPWRIHASPDDKYTIAVPEPAIYESTNTPTDDGRTTKTDIFQLGGKEARTFMVFIGATLPNDTRSVEEQLDAGVRGFVDKGHNTIVRVRDVSPAGLRGREIVGRGEDGTMMQLRLALAPGRIYVLAISAKHVEGLSGVEVERFFESFQVVPP
jgi:hypothetical protein